MRLIFNISDSQSFWNSNPIKQILKDLHNQGILNIGTYIIDQFEDDDTTLKKLTGTISIINFEDKFLNL